MKTFNPLDKSISASVNSSFRKKQFLVKQLIYFKLSIAIKNKYFNIIHTYGDIL